MLAHALAGELEPEVLQTGYRGHAATADAVRDGVEPVVVHGGDGTVNEVVNEMMDGTGSTRVDLGPGPAVAVVPGGSADVCALGSPRDPTAATAAIPAAERRSRTVGLGRMVEGDGTGSRWFTFNAGMGWDADVIVEMERMRAQGRRATSLRYTATPWRHHLRQRRDPRSISVEVPGTDPVELRFAFICNTDTWTYVGPHPVRTNPGMSFATGLGLFGPRDLGTGSTFTALREMLRPGGDPRGRNVLRRDVEFPAVSDALRVVV